MGMCVCVRFCTVICGTCSIIERTCQRSGLHQRKEMWMPNAIDGTLLWESSLSYSVRRGRIPHSTLPVAFFAATDAERPRAAGLGLR